jgi:stage V sporulation protein G
MGERPSGAAALRHEVPLPGGSFVDITSVRVLPIGEDRLKAFATIVLDGRFVVSNLRVVRGKSRLFVAMPSRRTRDGRYRDVAYPVDRELRERIEAAVLDAYHALPNPPG